MNVFLYLPSIAQLESGQNTSPYLSVFGAVSSCLKDFKNKGLKNRGVSSLLYTLSNQERGEWGIGKKEGGI